MVDLQQEHQTLERALADARRRRAALFNQQGEPIYSDQEHRERERAALEPLRQAAARAVEVGERELAEATAELARLAHTDPVASLPAEDLTRAASLLPFAERSVTHLRREELMPRIETVLNSKDRAQAAAYATALRAHPQFASIVERLETIAHPAQVRERERLQERRRDADLLRARGQTIVPEAFHASYEEAMRAQVLARGQYNRL